MLGVLAALLVVGAGATFQSKVERRLLGRWLEGGTFLWRTVGGGFQDRTGFVAALLLLVLAWGVSGVRVLRQRGALGAPWTTALLVAPALPFVLGPPFMSRDVYAYAAQGQLVLDGGNPYSQGIKALGRSTTVAAVDPMWRGTTSPYGPLALRLQEAAVWASGGHELLALALLRIVVVLCIAGSIVAVRRLAPVTLRTRATWLTCSPLLFVHVVAPVHLEAVVCLLLLTSLVLFTADRHMAAGALAICAAEVKVTALVMVVCLAVIAGARFGRHAVRRLLTGGVAAAGVCVLLLPSDPFGWVRGLSTPGSGWAPFTPSSAMVSGLDELLDLLSIQASGWLIPLVRLGFALAGIIVFLTILRPSGQTVATTAGLAILAAAAAAPVLWPWYLVPAVLLLSTSRSWVLPAVIGGTGAFLALPLGTSVAERLGAVAVIAGAMTALLIRRQTLNAA